jgi:hypothetical protein
VYTASLPHKVEHWLGVGVSVLRWFALIVRYSVGVQPINESVCKLNKRWFTVGQPFDWIGVTPVLWPVTVVIVTVTSVCTSSSLCECVCEIIVCVRL